MRSGENFAHRQHLKFCHFQHVHCASKNPISPKVFNRFSKSLPQLEDVEGRAFGWKVSGAQIFYFCNGKVKTLRIDNIWNFATFNLYTVPGKILYLQRYSTDFRNLCLSSKMLRWAFGRKVSGAQVFYFCNGKVKTLRIDNIWNFATFNLYTVPAKILYLQRYSIDFRNLCLSSKMLRVGIWVESFTWAPGIWLFKWQGENFVHRQHLKFRHFQHVQWGARKNPMSPKVFKRFSKSLPPARRCWGWAFGWKVSCSQVFYFCNGKVKTLRIDNIWNFATFNMYNVPAKILYLQRYSTDFRNLCLSSKMLRVGIWVQKVS